MKEANDQLRAARVRTASPTNPEVGLSRQELAEMVNKWVWDHHDKKVVLATARYIGKLETGEIRWPRECCREAFRAILSAPNDAALGFVNNRSRRAAVRLEKVDRQHLIRGGAALSVSTLVQGPVSARLEGLEGSRARSDPQAVGAIDIEHIRTVTRVFSPGAHLWRRAGPGCRDGTAALVSRPAGRRLPGRAKPRAALRGGRSREHRGVHSPAGRRYEEARQVSGFALACAEKAERLAPAGLCPGTMATQAIWTGQPDEGLTLIEFALVRADWLTETELTLLHSHPGARAG